MDRTVIFGFDSAWTDNSSRPGAICGFARDCASSQFIPPKLVTFAAAADLISSNPAAKKVIALDQPTIVANSNGMRPVEKVAASVVNSLKGAVQPAFTRRSDMFGSSAPIWTFLERVQAIQNPFMARERATGCFLMEVFPALALPGLIPEITNRHIAAKYNPANRSKYQQADWYLVCDGLAAFASELELSEISDYLSNAAKLENPDKSDQDKLDSVICLLIGLHWDKSGLEGAVVIGDGTSGYMVTPVSADTKAILCKSAASNGVAINQQSGFGADMRSYRPIAEIADEVKKKAGLEGIMVISTPPMTLNSPRKLDIDAVRSILISAAKARKILTYGDVLSVFGIKANSFSVAGRLAPILTAIGKRNLAVNEPVLSSIVVAKTTGLPGAGFYPLLGCANTDPSAGDRLIIEQKKVFLFDWCTE